MTWHEDAACIGADTNLFFPTVGKHWRPNHGLSAKAICAGCEVRNECLADALERREQHGIYGGLNPLERRALQYHDGVPCTGCGTTIQYPRKWCAKCLGERERMSHRQRSHDHYSATQRRVDDGYEPLVGVVLVEEYRHWGDIA